MINVTFWRLMAILGLMAFTLPVSAYQPQKEMKPSTQRSSTAEQRMEQRITRETGHQLRMLPRYGRFDNLTYKVEGGTVTLMGQVYNATLKDDAERQVKHIEGVEKVVNEIEILPVSSNDDRLRRRLSRAIFSNPRLSQYAIQPVPPIHIIVRNGHVSLEGVVRDQGDKNAAGISANGVPGVFSVENHLQVEKPEKGGK